MFARYPPLYQGCAETMRSVARKISPRATAFLKWNSLNASDDFSHSLPIRAA